MTHCQPCDRFWNSLPVRADRIPNELNDVAQLYQTQTDLLHPLNLSTPTFFRTAFGNINGDGDPTSFSSPILGMRNPHLGSAIEPKIAPFVHLIKDLGIITYSSCEGHQIKGNFYEAYVGILYSELQKVETSSILRFARLSGFYPFRTWLVDSLDGTHYKTVEIYFPHDTITSLNRYHDALTQATGKLTDLLKHENNTTRRIKA